MLRFDHVGIAVEDLEAALELWRDRLGVTVAEIETVPDQKVRVAFLDTGETHTELMEASADDSPIARFLASGRKGVHHLAYRVSDIEASLRELREHGVPIIHEQPVAGSRGTRVAFLHPRGTGGVLIELIEYPSTPDAEEEPGT